jgi:hypothetical protein
MTTSVQEYGKIFIQKNETKCMKIYIYVKKILEKFKKYKMPIENKYSGKYIGNWKERNTSTDSILNHICENPIYEDVDNIISYLKSGTIFALSLGIEKDILDNNNPIAGSGSVLTDGEWFWYDALPHYMKKYNFKLPTEFVQKIRYNNYLCKNVTRKELSKLTKKRREIFS